MHFLFGSLRHIYYWAPSDRLQCLVTGRFENRELLRVGWAYLSYLQHDHKS